MSKEAPWGLMLVKLEGLKAGHGQFLCETPTELLLAVQAAVIERKFGMAGDHVVIERAPPISPEDQAAIVRFRNRP